MTFKDNWKGLIGFAFAMGIFAYYVLRGGV
jgi:hypothetical protein